MPPPQNLPPITSFPHPDIYRALGADGIRDLLRAFYRNLAVSSISGLFPKDQAGLEASAEKSALFFVGICGGPPLYEQKYGAPKMRQRHSGFTITDEARVVWLSCWEEVLKTAPETFGFPAEHLNSFREYLVTFSKWMVNA
jgi:hemoglobin